MDFQPRLVSMEELKEEIVFARKMNDGLRDEIKELEKQNEEYKKTLKLIKTRLMCSPAVVDTIWIDDTEKCCETLVDRINQLLDEEE